MQTCHYNANNAKNVNNASNVNAILMQIMNGIGFISNNVMLMSLIQIVQIMFMSL